MTVMMPIQNSTSSLAQLLKAAADDLRLAILQVLATDSYGVMELAQAFDIKQSGMSHHLKVLATAQLVDTRREGNSIFYRRSVITQDDPFAKTKKALFQQLDNAPFDQTLLFRLEAIWLEREKTSQRFFVENADKFSEQQDLIANFEVYRSQVTEMLDASPLQTYHKALEVGPGRGEFLPTLAQKFTQVLALDNSRQMLDLAKETAHQKHLDNIDWQLGDTHALSKHTGQFDCAIINMVLHHTPSPRRIFQDVAAALKPNAVLLVTELCLHHQDWAQNACGDIWLGFTPEDLIQWAAEAHLEHGQGAYFALRNGFQIQIHQFIKPSL